MNSKRLLNTVIGILLSLLLGTFLMVLTYLIPIERVEINARNSSDLFSNNIIKTWSGDLRYAKLDTSTDAIMVNNAICREYDSAIENALLNPRYNYSNILTSDVEQESLIKALEEESDYEIINYSRYWHGYLVFLVPSMLFLNIGQIRFFLMIVQLLLSFYVVCELNKKDKILMIAFAIVECFLCPITTSLNLVDSIVNCIMMIFLLFIFRNSDFSIKNYYYIFLINGIIVAFLDFFTYPIVALCIPLITTIYISREKILVKIKMLLSSFTAWTIGYVCMWTGKSFISNILTSENSIENAFNRVLHYSKSNNQSMTFFGALKRNLEVFDNAMYILIIFGIFLCLFAIFKNKLKFNLNRKIFYESLLYVFFMIVPIIWYGILVVPTYIHPWYHYRNIAVAIYATFMIVGTLTKKREEL